MISSGPTGKQLGKPSGSLRLGGIFSGNFCEYYRGGSREF